MFDLAQRQLEQIGKEFIILAQRDVVLHTRGFGNQRPEDTEYIPTGRLRGGWFWSATKFNGATRWDGGPYSDYGVEIADRIESEVRASPLPRISYIENDVAYGEIVRLGLGNHVSQDTWILDTANKMPEFARQARLKVMRGGDV